MNLPVPFALDPNSTITRRNRESITTFIDNLRYIIITPLSFESYPESIYTAPLIRQHHDSYLFYIETHSFTENAKIIPFSIISNTLQHVYNKQFHPSIVFIPISQVFFSKLEELNNLTDQPIFVHSAIHALHGMDSYFEDANLEQF